MSLMLGSSRGRHQWGCVLIRGDKTGDQVTPILATCHYSALLGELSELVFLRHSALNPNKKSFKTWIFFFLMSFTGTIKIKHIQPEE